MPNTKKKILVVDDNAINRAVLCEILNDYETIEANNGQEAIDILKQCQREICLVLLDLYMPVMDGYAFLYRAKENNMFAYIPVIVTTGMASEEDEVRCLYNGASDFITKPYKTEVVRRRVESILRLRETSAMLNMMEFDPLTGLYNKQFFFHHATKVMERYPNKKYTVICVKTKKFELLNERYGEKAGDDFLRYLANKYRELNPEGIYARLSGNTFACLMESSFPAERIPRFVKEVTDNAPVPNQVILYGVYANVDEKVSISTMCDRALLAMSRIKKQYGNVIGYYDDKLRCELLREQQILDSMEDAIKEKQFQVYYQPKHDVHTGKIIGAEALVRWIHPKFGFMSPAEFIPLFEKNGFISRLDSYVWEEVCAELKKQQDVGLPVVPVSVNVSRADFIWSELADQIQALTDTYGIDNNLLHLEVTESTYNDNEQQIIMTVAKLRRRGFKIEMDDFGSGYSSLTMLSELPMDVLKLDKSFINELTCPKKQYVLNFVIKLAQCLEVDVIAEGVETEEQLQKLKDMGCIYVQGYYYAKPMPTEEFEKYLITQNRRCGGAQQLA
jgi:diguanylate cyclase (GGDEF)-like protein